MHFSIFCYKGFDNPKSKVLHPKRTCEANPVGEESSFIFTVCIKSVALYHFKLSYVVLHMAVTELFDTHF